MDALILVPALVVIGGVGALITFPWRTGRLGRGWPWIGSTFLPPILNHVWGRLFAVDPGVVPPPPAWHEDMLLGFLALSVALIVVVALRVRQSRRFGVAVSIMMLGVTLGTGLLAAMQVSGAWL